MIAWMMAGRRWVSGVGLLGVFLSGGGWVAAHQTESPPPLDEVVADIVGSEEMVVLSVDKTHLRAELRTWPEEANQSKLIRTFRIALGKNEGDKVHEGDNRTPEGIYFSQKHIDGRSLPAKYGSKAITLNFPNPIDQKNGVTGFGIWLHGVERSSRIEEAKVTEGCVVFYNTDISALGSWLTPHQGVVVIAKDLGDVNQQRDHRILKMLSHSWMEAWKNRKIDSYIGFYGKDFKNRGKDRDAYRQYKDRVFNSYSSMKVDFENVRVIAHPKYALTLMNQRFQGDESYYSEGRKLLYWSRDEEGLWRITREVFESQKIKLVQFNDSLFRLFRHGPFSQTPSEAPPTDGGV